MIIIHAKGVVLTSADVSAPVSAANKGSGVAGQGCQSRCMRKAMDTGSVPPLTGAWRTILSINHTTKGARMPKRYRSVCCACLCMLMPILLILYMCTHKHVGVTLTQ